ncbi:hypothetical protein DAEQUDRAFT_476057 [Daedalea quercina L-15889]|uniref:Uncharacterized protein n=1 Tax=Daedalea quercina L-15889 TaxID=1314783 RepID=A0A165MXY4_9APHY|nr:hypothetical protein DAEQUDRAFT_476057 [Daedalea quercina L-15889]
MRWLGAPCTPEGYPERAFTLPPSSRARPDAACPATFTAPPRPASPPCTPPRMGRYTCISDSVSPAFCEGRGGNICRAWVALCCTATCRHPGLGSISTGVVRGVARLGMLSSIFQSSKRSVRAVAELGAAPSSWYSAPHVVLQRIGRRRPTAGDPCPASQVNLLSLDWRAPSLASVQCPPSVSWQRVSARSRR